ncbi:septum formation inhibitor Maf [Muricauda sp. JGD-17]|uniref:Septum formation inhibitor Maf n=1 Tax=Flagellimonas ochracea TaxID=2696472 RepID=A0A964WWK7_9FLAO|nr:septum formation inhibitor Maf [Allomuricauda ochracea]NAY91166.1 septum formation inhibitor Maf [Allomuricauda ochracea]
MNLKRSFNLFIPFFSILFLLHTSCKEQSIHASNKALTLNELAAKSKNPFAKKPISEAFKEYWYAGKAEITSYTLEQARYGEIRNGHAVLVFVTEPFLPEKQVKADRSNGENVSVLKLNATKKYLTGIYPYSIMGSTFYPVDDNQHALKTSLSVQEWCGHVYSQVNNRENFEFTSHSYFESEADQQFELEKNVLENEIWARIRINPNDLPVGEIQMIPSLEFVRLRHQRFQAHNATATLSSQNGIQTYTIYYPDLDRTLSIDFSEAFPHSIEGWQETFKSGFGPNAKSMTSVATKRKTIQTAYWGQNSNEDVILRDSLGL